MYENDVILKYAHQITRQGFILVRGTPWNSQKDMGEARNEGEPTPENDLPIGEKNQKENCNEFWCPRSFWRCTFEPPLFIMKETINCSLPSKNSVKSC